MKTIIFVSIIMAFLVLYGCYLWDLKTVTMGLEEQKIRNYSAIGVLTLSMLLFYVSGLDTDMLKQFFIIAFIILLVTFIVIVLVQLYVISNPYYVLGVFYGANFVFAAIILIVGVRHDAFKD